jgi:uncharacterized protein YecT (DUF1311 family)
MKTLASVPVLLMLLVPTWANAQTTPTINCASPKNMLEINECGMREQKVADAKLQHLTQTILGRIRDEEIKTMFRDAEKEWLVYRQKECEFETSPNRGGTVYGANFGGCLMELNTLHMKMLQAILDCKGGECVIQP